MNFPLSMAYLGIRVELYWPSNGITFNNPIKSYTTFFVIPEAIPVREVKKKLYADSNLST